MLEVNNLSISFIQYEKGLKQKTIQVISDLNIKISKGEILAIVGSSGSGKSLLAHAILGILPKNALMSGTILYDGRELTTKRQKKLRGNEIAFIPQSVNFLDPLMKVGSQVRSSVSAGEKKEKQRKIFDRYSLDSRTDSLFPFQLSGGMARRVLVASAVVGGAKLIVADEPTPGLHPEVVNETLGHLRELANQGCAILLITHDIGTALNVADSIAVFYSGITIEISPVSDFSGKGESLRHPYTKALWNALPQNDFNPIDGFQPSHIEQHSGCPFNSRCTFKSSECVSKLPLIRDVRFGKVRCYHAT
ncbi:UNVERIFIED_CONTAM: peptide/nickel transport system ATP-binding protein [Acetivibrio alkalicellulosi]